MKTIGTLVGTVILAVSTNAIADDRMGFELRPGAAFATDELGDADLGVGLGIEGTLSVRFLPHLAAYAGWGWNRFTAERSFAGTDVDFEETGYTFGLQFVHPIRHGLHYMVQAGGVFAHVEFENTAGDLMADTGHGLGWQAGAGIAIDLGKNWRLMPSVRYRFLSRDVTMNGDTVETDLQYLSAGAGISLGF